MRPMVESDLEQVRLWRNHPSIRRFMFQTAEIFPEQHLHWFQSAKQNPNKHLLVFECGKQPFGFVNVSQVSGAVMEWGFYKRPDAPQGTGFALGTTALHYVFQNLKAIKLCGQVIAYNFASRRFHEKLGFQLEGVLRKQHHGGADYHDVYCYGLLQEEWQQQDNNHE